MEHWLFLGIIPEFVQYILKFYLKIKSCHKILANGRVC